MVHLPSDKLKIWSDLTPGPIHQIENNWGHDHLYIKRLDLIQSWASGNKYYKLKYNLHETIYEGTKTIVSKGGMFSNHLQALAEACHIFGIECVCVIRSYTDDELNPSIQRLRELSCRLVFLKPEVYDAFDEKEAHSIFPEAKFIPEGGADKNGIQGAAEILEECLSAKPDHLIIAGGTMSTAAGILSAAPSTLNVIIVSAWKGCTNEYIDKILDQHAISPKCSWVLWLEYHFGGFARYNQEFADFMFSFTHQTGIHLDPIYTGKMMYAVKTKIEAGYFSKDESILAIHTGGLQGIEGFNFKDPDVWNNYYTIGKRAIIN